MLITLKCEYCNVEFERDSRRKRKTCSEECRQKIYRKTRQYDKGYRLTPELVEKIKSGKRKSQLTKIENVDNVEPRKKGAPAKFIINDEGILTHKECTVCSKLLEAEAFKLTTGRKQSKTNLRSSCRSCEHIARMTKRRHDGIPSRVLPTFKLDADGNLVEKECTKCLKLRKADDYCIQKGGRWNKRSSCRFCEANRSTMANYGINTEAKLAAYKEQGGCCDICKSQKTIKALYIDHDHSVPRGGGFRGLLCRTCNFAYGVLGDGNDKTPDILRGMLDYYMKTKRD